MDGDTQHLSDTYTPPSRKRTHNTAGDFMTPVRRIFLRLEWSKSSKKRKGTTAKQPKPPASTYQGLLSSISEKSPMLSPQDASMTSPLRTPERDNRLFKTVLGSEYQSTTNSLGDRGFSNDLVPPFAGMATPLRRPARLAIQQEDALFDAVVVTTLPSYPFCCHEDLLSMSREELVNVASKLNSRLPSTSQIPVDDWVPQGVVRGRIEVLVGIRPPVPMAPKAVKCAQPLSMAMDVDGEGDLGDGMLPSPPSSPLARREKRRGSARITLSGRISRRRGQVQGNTGQWEDQTMSGVVGGTCISPRRILEPLDEESEPSSEGGAMMQLYQESDTDVSIASLDMLDEHSTKRRKVSGDGQYMKVFTGSAFFTPRSPTPLSSLPKLLFASDSRPWSHQPGAQYKFSVRRKPVAEPRPERSVEAELSPSLRVHASDSIDMLFNGGPMAPPSGGALFN